MNRVTTSTAPATPLARSLALGHFVEKSIQQGRLRSHASAAGVLGVSRNRVSQLVSLTFLAPDIQEEVLHLDAGSPLARLSERLVLDVVARHLSWPEQRRWWSVLNSIVAEYRMPLGACSVEQLIELHERLLGTKATTTRREELVLALGETVAPPKDQARHD